MTTWAWVGGRLEPVDRTVDGPVRAADSWRSVDGRVRRFDLHRARFVTSVARIAGLDAGPFVDAARVAVPDVGEWFPRVRLVGDTLLLDVRPGPPRVPEVAVRVLDVGDPRSAPRIKGPDLALAGDLVAAAREHGAGEVLLRDADGVVLEAGWAAVVWWDGDDLCVPSPTLPVLPSVTRAVVEDLARAQGVRVRRVTAGLEDLDGAETWLLNAYQGLRLVTGWVGAPLQAGPGHRAATWRTLLDRA